MALYLVGDIQGCFDELQLLLQKINFSADDTLWISGDLVARGPKSLETLRWVKQQSNVFTVLGNHDLHLLAVAAGIKPAKERDLTRAILEADDKDELLAWLRQQPLLMQHSEYPLVMTHAGILPSWSVEQAQQLACEVEQQLKGEDYLQLLSLMYNQEPRQWHTNLSGYDRWRFIINAFTRMRFCTLDGSLDFDAKIAPDQCSDSLIPWFKLHQQQQDYSHHLAFGHWAALMGQTQHSDYIGLDTGCVWGAHLSAYCWQTQKTVTQPALLQLTA